MNMEKSKCKRCLLYEQAESDAYKSVRSYIDSLPSCEKVDEEEYRKRLSICKTCDCLLFGLCRKCGCYCEVRAVLSASHCPHEKSRW